MPLFPQSNSCRAARAALMLVVALFHLVVVIHHATAASPPNALSTLSARAHVGSAENVVIGGFIIRGSDSKQVLVRGLGTSLAVSSPLADPMIELRDPSGEAVASNDNWQDTQQAAITATGQAPSQNTESALLATLAPGNYTVVLRGKNNGTGVGKIDVIDVDDSSSSRIDNMSTRALVSAGSNVLIGGFVINGPQNRRLIIRGLGASLYYIENRMSNPTLQLRDSSGNLLVFNDDWEDRQRDEIIDSTLPPAETAESAIVATLAPGAYTAELIGACGGGGVALMEVYDLGADAGVVRLPASSPQPTCFSTWAAERNLTGADAARTADPDGDGDLNLVEYAVGKNPKVADGPATNGGIVEVQGEKYLSLSFTWPTGDAAPSDITYRVERATALAPANWLSSPTHLVVHSIAAGPGALETVTVRSKHPLGATAREFLRLKITATTE